MTRRAAVRGECAWCGDRPRSALRRLGKALICRDPHGCYARFRARMIREGRWAVDADGHLHVAGDAP